MNGLYIIIAKPNFFSLGIVIKQSSISSVFTYLGTIIGFANTVVLFPAFLSSEQIGLMRVLPSAAFMIMPIAQLGLGRTLVKFAPEVRKHENGLSNFVSLLLVGILGGFVVTSALLLLFKKQVFRVFASNSPLFNDYFYVVICLILVLALYTFFEAYGRIFLKIIFLNIIREILVRLLMSVAVTLYFLKLVSFHEVILGLILIYSLALLCMIVYLIYNKELTINPKPKIPEKHFLNRVASYAGYSILGASGGYVILNIDQVMITSLIGLDANGIYTTAFFFAVMIELSRRAITQITTPLVSEFFEDRKINEIEKIHKQISINQMAIGILFFIGITCNLNNIYDLMPNGDVYRSGTMVVFLIGLSKLIDMAFSNNGEVITMSDHYRFNVISMVVLALLMIGFNYILIPIFGLNGAAMATLSAVFMYNIVKMAFIKIKLGFTPFSQRNIVLLFIGISVFLAAFYIPRLNNPLIDLIMRSLMTSIVYGMLIYFSKVSKEINGIVNAFLKKVR